MSKKNQKIVIPNEEEVAEYGSQGNPQEADGDSSDAAPDASSSGEVSADESTAETPRNEAEEWKDKYLRAKAELANYQRRMEKERSESLKYANTGLVKALLSVIDDLERVITSGQMHKDNADAILDGVKLTLDNLLKVLEQFDVKRIEAEGQAFDPGVHEAMMEQPSPEHPERVVLQELAKGYTLHDRVVRPAKVIVSKPEDSGPADQPPDDEQEAES